MKLTVITRRANSSRIANEIEKAFENTTFDVTVSENAPCSIKANGTFPSREGWKEVEKLPTYVDTLNEAAKKYHTTVFHIKTATLGGRSRIWVLA